MVRTTCILSMHAGVANVSNTVIEAMAAGGLHRVRVRARALPATSAEALEAAAAAVDVLRRAPDAQAAAEDTIVQVSCCMHVARDVGHKCMPLCCSFPA